MGWRFRKSVKIIPGVRLNFSSRGVSTSIGVRGAGVNLSSRGVYAYGSIPGTGISYREKIGGGKGKQSGNIQAHESYADYNPALSEETFSYSRPDNIISLDVQEITSQDMQGIKDLIIGTHEQRKSIAGSIPEVEKELSRTKLKLTLSYIFLFGFIFKSFSEGLKADIEAQKETLDALKEQLENSSVKLEVGFDNSIKRQYERMAESFKKLTFSHKVWDVTSEYWEDQLKTRAAASTVIKRQEIKLDMKHIPDINTEYTPLFFQNANGADLYIYPNFLIAYKGQTELAVIGYDELDFRFRTVQFVEEEVVPSDSKIISKTWAKVNKNGQPDKRFKDNYEIPVVRYGDIYLSTNTGLSEGYEFSNYEQAAEFAENFIEYQKTIKALKPIPEAGA